MLVYLIEKITNYSNNGTAKQILKREKFFIRCSVEGSLIMIVDNIQNNSTSENFFNYWTPINTDN